MSTRLFSRFRVVEPTSEAAASGMKSPREALNEQWLRIRAGLGGSSTIDSMDAVYEAELRELRRRSAEHEGSGHRNPVMRALVHEASRIAENCTTNVRDVILVATLQH